MYPIKTLHTEVLLRNRWYAIRRDDILLPDGSLGEYNVVDRRDAVFIIPVLPDGRIVLIRHYRHTVRDWVWAVPAGSIEDGIDPTAMARTELREEIGGRTESLTLVGDFFTMPGISNERSYVFLARDVRLGTHARDPTEIIESHILEKKDVYDMVRRGAIKDAPCALALCLVEHLLEDG